MDAGGNALEALGTVVDPVHARHDGEKHLRRANVGRGAVALDVLFPRLERHAEGGAAVRVDGAADDAAGHEALVLFFRGKESGVRSAKAHGNAKALGAAQDDVGAPASGLGQQGQGKEVGGDGYAHFLRLAGSYKAAEVFNLTHRVGVLNNGAKEIARRLEALGVAHDQFDVHGDGAGLEQGLRLGKYVAVHEEFVGVPLLLLAAACSH